MSRAVLERWDWACYVAAGQLSTAQRAVLGVVARHAGENGTGSRISQAMIAESTDLVDRSVRRALDRLKALGLIVGELRSGKTTVWTLNLEWTPDSSVQGQASAPRTPASGVPGGDPGHTPDTPRTLVSYEGEGEGTTTPSLSVNEVAARGEGEDEIEFDPRRLVTLRRVPS